MLTLLSRFKMRTGCHKTTRRKKDCHSAERRHPGGTIPFDRAKAPRIFTIIMKIFVTDFIIVLCYVDPIIWAQAWLTPKVVARSSNKNPMMTSIHTPSDAERHLDEMQQLWKDLQQREKEVEESNEKVRLLRPLSPWEKRFRQRDIRLHVDIASHYQCPLPLFIDGRHGAHARNIGNCD